MPVAEPLSWWMTAITLLVLMTITAIFGWSRRVEDEVPQAIPDKPNRATADAQLPRWKDLYHKLQNLTANPEVLPQARDVLLSLLREAWLVERYKGADRSILQIEDYDLTTLKCFLLAQEQDVFDDWERYVRCRAQGAKSSLFNSREEARAWLKNSAPLNFIDGAWLSHIHKVTAPFAQRTFTCHAWQTLSEELGDGDITKNHIFIYRQLLRDLGVNLPPADSVEFVREDHGMDDPGMWKTGVGHLLISLFPNDFLPEILGFNLAFEQLSTTTLKASRELPEYGISGHYFSLHISIDNAHSGHSAMALQIVEKFMAQVKEREPEKLQTVWRRVQSGYLLSQGLDNGESLQKYEMEIDSMFRSKARLSHHIHCASRVQIGTQSLPDWLKKYGNENDRAKRLSLLSTLETAKPWIYKGDSQKSLLMRELSWNGKMFGAFTNSEILLVRVWIDSLIPGNETASMAYERMVGCIGISELPSFPTQRRDLACTRPLLRNLPQISYSKASDGQTFHSWTQPTWERLEVTTVAPLWFTHACILENVTCSPSRTADGLATHAIKLIHAEMGNSPADGVAGIHGTSSHEDHLDLISIGLEIMEYHNFGRPNDLGDVLDLEECYAGAIDFCYDLLGWSMQYVQHEAFLLGLSRAFYDFEQVVCSGVGLLPPRARKALRRIINRKAPYYAACMKDLASNPEGLADFCNGYNIGRRRLDAILM